MHEKKINELKEILSRARMPSSDRERVFKLLDIRSGKN